MPHALLAHQRGESRRNSGACGFEIRPLSEMYLLRFYSSINVGLYFADSFHCTCINIVVPMVNYLQVNRGPWL